MALNTGNDSAHHLCLSLFVSFTLWLALIRMVVEGDAHNDVSSAISLVHRGDHFYECILTKDKAFSFSSSSMLPQQHEVFNMVVFQEHFLCVPQSLNDSILSGL